MIQPIRIDLNKWASSLVVDFPNDNIPILKNDDWKTWGNDLIQENSFYVNSAPSTFGYPDWNSWAKAVFYTMANFS